MSSPSWADGIARTRNPARSIVLAGIEPHEPIAPAGPAARACSTIASGRTSTRAGRGRQQVGQRPRVEVVGVLVAGQDEVDVRAGRRPAAAPGSSGRAAGRSPRISASGAPRGRGRRRASPCRDLIRKPLCPSHQTHSDPGPGSCPRSPRPARRPDGPARSSLQLSAHPLRPLRPSPWPWPPRRAAPSARTRSRA